VAATLAGLAAAFGPDRPAVVCRELTKTHEEVRRGTLGELASWAAGPVLGEITLVVAGAPAAAPPSPLAAAAQVAAREAAGAGRREAIAAVARETGLPRREVYNAVVGLRRPGPGDGAAS
jgi:16S rRNA (cytidine1402-2'-O)-methyltransferase